MSHRHLLLSVAAIGAIAAGCSSSSAVATTPTPVKCQVALEASSQSIAADGGTGTVAVTASPECPWDASTSAEWLSGLSPASGQGSGTVAFRVAPNPQASAREASIVVNNSSFRVSQQAASCRFELQPASLTVGAAGESREIRVSAGACAWTAATDASWISFTTPVRGSGDATVAFRIAPNRADDQRVGTITVGDQRSTVTQAGVAGLPCTFDVSPGSQSVSSSGATGLSLSVNGPSDCPWTATSSAAWIVVTDSTIGRGSGTVGYNVAANAGGARTGAITVAGQTVTVMQAAAGGLSCTYNISPTNTSIAAAGGSGGITVSAGTSCAWTAGSNAGWLAITSGTSGSGNGSVAFSVAANVEGARTGTISVAGQTFTVTQAAASQSCTYTINPTNATAAASGGSGSIAVSAGNGCAWTAGSNAGWLTITSGTSGSGNGSIAYSVAANTGGSRSAGISAGGQTFSLTQAAASQSCTYSLSSNSISTDWKAESVTVNVSAGSGCTWTASSNASWITITSGSSGNGNGSVAFNIPKNDDDDRTGTLTIAGQTFTVSQRKK